MAKADSPAPAALVGVLGSVKARRFPTGTGTLTLGAAADCGVQIKGELVSERHAILRPSASGQWTIVNQSPYGTVVNEKLVEEATLTHGDLIQIGQSAMLRFETAGDTKPVAGGPVIGWLKQRPLIAAGLGIYLVAILAVAIVLSMRSGSDEATTALTLQQIAESRELTIKQLGDSSDGRRSAEQAYAVMVDAWAFEQQGRWNDALAAYGRVGDLLPDPQLSLTRLANNRAAAVRLQLPSD